MPPPDPVYHGTRTEAQADAMKTTPPNDGDTVVVFRPGYHRYESWVWCDDSVIVGGGWVFTNHGTEAECVKCAQDMVAV